MKFNSVFIIRIEKIGVILFSCELERNERTYHQFLSVNFLARTYFMKSIDFSVFIDSLITPVIVCFFRQFWQGFHHRWCISCRGLQHPSSLDGVRRPRHGDGLPVSLPRGRQHDRSNFHRNLQGTSRQVID